MSKNKFWVLVGGVIAIILTAGLGALFFFTNWDRTIGILGFEFGAFALLATIIAAIKYKG